MGIVIWDESYNTGIAIIDQQHRQLFEILNRLHEKRRNPKADRVDFLTTLDSLDQYARFHFREEEQLMTDAAYPELDAHRDQHQAFKEKLAEFQQQSHTGDLKELFDESLSYLFDYLVRHVQQEDRRYIPYLKPT